MRNIIIKYLKNKTENRKRRTFNLDELEAYILEKLGGETPYSDAGAYSEFYQVLKDLEDDGHIIPVKNSPLNGKNPSLKTRWRIVTTDKVISWDNKRFFQYSDLLDLSFYQRNPGYQTEEEWQKIEPIYFFLKEREEREWASLEERSLELFADEKYFYESRNKAVLKRINVSLADLKAKKYGEMFIYWRMVEGVKNIKSKVQDILILENHSTFFSCKRVLQKGQSILGKKYDVLIFGEGKKIIKSLSFLEEISDTDNLRVFYFGDIDPEGFMIYRLLKERYSDIAIELCLPLYRELLQTAEKSYICEKQRRNERDLQFVLAEFTAGNYAQEVERLRKLWYNGKRIPQELITYEYLINLDN